MENKYPKAYKEVIEILKYVPKESVDKIPQEMIEMFKTKMDVNYDFKIDISKEFEEQILLEETKAILANIFRDYWATPSQRKEIEAKDRYEMQKIEEEKMKKYNIDVFNQKNNSKKIEEEKEELPAEVNKEKFFDKIINFFKRIFNI